MYQHQGTSLDRIAITGIGLLDTLGSTPYDCFKNMISSTYIDPINFVEFKSDSKAEIVNNVKVFPVYTKEFNLPELHPAMLNVLSRGSKFALHVLESALNDAGVDKTAKNVATFMSHNSAGHDLMLDCHLKVLSGSKSKPRVLVQGVIDFVGGLITETYGFLGPSISVSAACASGLYTLDYACRVIDEYDYVICGASDCGITEQDLYNFVMLGALGDHSAPFDDNRNGFIMGDGAGCMILERESKAKARNAKIYGYVHNVGLSSDAHHSTAPEPNGRGAKIAMEKALRNIDKNEIAFCNAHATSTPVGDDIEYRAIQDVLGDIPIVSYKGKIGHTMGSSSLIETIYSLMSLNEKTIIPNFNLKSCAFDDANLLITEPTTSVKRYAMKNSFGFGGKCASVIIEQGD